MKMSVPFVRMAVNFVADCDRNKFDVLIPFARTPDENRDHDEYIKNAQYGLSIFRKAAKKARVVPYNSVYGNMTGTPLDYSYYQYPDTWSYTFQLGDTSVAYEELGNAQRTLAGIVDMAVHSRDKRIQ